MCRLPFTTLRIHSKIAFQIEPSEIDLMSAAAGLEKAVNHLPSLVVSRRKPVKSLMAVDEHMQRRGLGVVVCLKIKYATGHPKTSITHDKVI